jgi:hypothetical protein
MQINRPFDVIIIADYIVKCMETGKKHNAFEQKHHENVILDLLNLIILEQTKLLRQHTHINYQLVIFFGVIQFLQ